VSSNKRDRESGDVSINCSLAAINGVASSGEDTVKKSERVKSIDLLKRAVGDIDGSAAGL
jgi:hypothetical protein